MLCDSGREIDQWIPAMPMIRLSVPCRLFTPMSTLFTSFPVFMFPHSSYNLSTQLKVASSFAIAPWHCEIIFLQPQAMRKSPRVDL